MTSEIQLLQWQIDMGADEALEDTPVNRLIKKEKIVSPATQADAPPSVSAPAKPQVMARDTASHTTIAPSEAVLQARTLADTCTTIEELKQAVASFEGCSLKKTATNTVFSDGNPAARIMLIGEAPGANEDAEGIPFCGASGKLLDQVLASVGLYREHNIYISNTLFWRPPGNRKPSPEELSVCAPFVEKHIALVNPALLILAGSTAASSLLATKSGITKLRGQFYDYQNLYLEKAIQAAVIFHPSYLLRQPSQKKHIWMDMLRIKAHLAEKNILSS